MTYKILLDEIHSNIKKIIKESNWQAPAFVVEPSKPGFGDITCNVSFLLSKHLKKKPYDIAKLISEKYSSLLGTFIKKVEAHQSGYLNFFIDFSKFNKIVFDAYESANSQRLQIWIKNLQTNELYKFTESSRPCITPSWSNNGEYIAYHSNNKLKIKNVNNGSVRSVPNTNGGGSPDWNSDDTKLVFTSGPDSNRNITIINLDGSNKTQISHHEGREGRPNWSSDDQKVIYEVFGNTNQAVTYFKNLLTDKTYQLGDNFLSGNPSWSPDGTKILFTKNGIACIEYNSN